MYTAVTLFLIIVCLLLTLIVLVQNSKGGGLASNLGISSNQFGVKKTSDFLEKLTWGLAISLVVLCLGINVLVSGDVDSADTTPGSINVEKALESKSLPTAPAPKATPAPAESAPEAKPADANPSK